jgi:L-rhamnonate dehydratase
MKITSVRAVRIEYPRIPQKTKPRKADKYAGKIATGSPMSTSLGGRYFHTEGWWDNALMKGIGAGIERDVGCIVECEDGSWGFGFSDRGRITASIINDYIAPNLIGRNVFETEKVYDMMTRILSPVGSNSFSTRAISAVDLALWDLKGKLLNKPVYELLGGSVTEKLPIYASSNNTEWLKELGFKNFKRFISWGPRDQLSGINKVEQEIADARDLIGYESELMLDCWLSMDIETTVRVSEQLKPYKLKWIEDALISESINQYEILRNRIPQQTLATGEHWYGVHPFFHAASKGIIDILQPDITWVGGLSAIIKIVHIAESAGIDVILHGGGGSVFGQHASYGLTGISMIECSGPVITPIGVPLEEKDRFPGTPVPINGTIIPSDAPGFGLEIKKEWFPDFFS